MRLPEGLIPARHHTEDRPNVICLCGSTKFKEDFIRLNFELTLAGFIVLSVGFYMHTDKAFIPTVEEKNAMDRLHKEKINISDYVLIIDTHDYIGDSTRSEMEHALVRGKPVFFASSRAGEQHRWLPINPVSAMSSA